MGAFKLIGPIDQKMVKRHLTKFKRGQIKLKVYITPGQWVPTSPIVVPVTSLSGTT